MSRYSSSSSSHDNRRRDSNTNRRSEPELTAEQRLLNKLFDAPLELGYARLADLARLVEDECRLSKLDQAASKGLLDCAEFLPHKARLYAVLAGLVNAKMPAFGALVAELACARLAASLGEGNWGVAAARLRMLGELCGARVVGYRILSSVLQQLLSRDAISRPAVSLVLAALPWFGRSLALREAQVLDAAMAAIGELVESSAAAVPRAVCVFSNDDPATDSQLLWAWDQILSLKRCDWECESAVAATPSTVESALERAQTHTPGSAEGAQFALRPRDRRVTPEESMMVFRLFDRAVSEKDCTAEGADRLVVEAYIVEMMRHFCESPDFLAQRLLTLPVKAAYDHILIETILGQLLQLPHPEHKPLFYYSLLSHLIRGPAAARLAPVLMQAIDVLFQNVDRLDPECRERTMELLAFHLSNFGFKFDWPKWESVLKLPEDDCQVIFVRAVLARCVRLSYWARIEREMPSPQWVALMPPNPVPDPAVAMDPEVLAAVKGGVTLRPEQLTLDLLVPAILAQGETFSLLKLVLRQYGSALRQLANSEEAKLQILRIVGSYWANSEGQRLMVADLFMGVLAVDHLSIVQWVFAEHSASLLSYSPWEILHMAFGKTVMRTEFLRAQNNPAKLETQLREEKDLFLTTFQRFVIVLESYLASSGALAGQENAWFKNVLAQMTAFARRYRRSVDPFVTTLETIVFSDDCDARIRAAFQVAVALGR